MRGLLLCLVACAAPPGGANKPSPWADVVLAAPGTSDASFHDPDLAANGAYGAGWSSGSFDVFSLDRTPETGFIVLGWSGRRVIDGKGPDLVVFENAFALSDGSRFMDPTVVSVSADGTSWVAFDHSFVGDPLDPSWPDGWLGFAGLTPTLLNEASNPVDPFEPEAAGGDAFDLRDLPEGPVRDAILADGAFAVRLESPDPTFPRDTASNGPDIDAVYAHEWVDDASSTP